MIYGTTELITQRGSTSITKTRMKSRIHIPYTNRTETIEKGRQATIINTTILTFTEAEKNIIEALLHSPGRAQLYISDHFYKDVESGESFTPKPRTADKKDEWIIDAQFVALDPIPYNSETGEALY